MITPADTTTDAAIDPGTEIGSLSLNVGDLARSIGFYTDVIGFSQFEEGTGEATLGVGKTALLRLFEIKDAPPAPFGTTGLYHFAILTPSRLDLARSLHRLAERRYPLGGSSDHLVSEALYLSDPDNNGIEIYRDRPRDSWPRQNGQIQMATDPLDLQALLNEAAADPRPWTGLAEGTRIGHMHLRVADIPQARDFYHGVLGFDIVVDMERMGALFISAGGYHHHIGLNTWESRGGGPAPAGSAGLRQFTILLPSSAAVAPVLSRLDSTRISYRSEAAGVVVEDPWRNEILLTTSS